MPTLYAHRKCARVPRTANGGQKGSCVAREGSTRYTARTMTRSTVAGRCHLRQLVMYWLWMPPVAPLWNACAAGGAAGKVRLIQSNAMRWYPLVPSQQVEMLPPTTPAR